MPKIVINTTNASLQVLRPNPTGLLSWIGDVENLLVRTLLAELKLCQIPITDPTDVETSWPVIMCASNAADLGVDIMFSQQDEEGAPGLRKLNPEERVHLRNSVLEALKTTDLLPDQVSVSVWVMPITGGAFAMAYRPAKNHL